MLFRSYFFTLVILLSFSIEIVGQQKVNWHRPYEAHAPIEVTSKRNVKSKPINFHPDILFNCHNKTNENYTVLVQFSNMSGYISSENIPYVGIVPPGKKQLFRLESNSVSPGGAENFSFSYLAGSVTKKLKSKIEYGLPVGGMRPTQVVPITAFTVFFNTDQFAHGIGYTFETFKGDTIYASRKGNVMVSGMIEMAKDGSLISKLNRTEFKIEHPDNSVGKYHVYGSLELLVKQDQTVYPGQPLAVIRALEADERMMHFMVYYFTRKTMIDSVIFFDEEGFWKFHKPKFHVDGKGRFLKEGESYSATFSKKMQEQEMSKKEKKEFFQ